MLNKRICSSCKYWRIGVPCGSCSIEPFLYTNDKMVFEDATDICPLENKGDECCIKMKS